MLAAMSAHQFNEWRAFYWILREQDMKDHLTHSVQAGLQQAKGNVV